MQRKSLSEMGSVLLNPEYLGLLREVCADPGDYGVRLVLADWLEDNNEEEWSAFILGQIGRDGIEGEGTGGLPGVIRLAEQFPEAAHWGWRVAGGFVEGICMPAADFTEELARKLFGLWPLTIVHLEDRVPFGQHANREARSWQRGVTGGQSDEVATWLWPFLSGGRLLMPSGHIRIYDNNHLAWADLDRACVAAGRLEAGLPELKQGKPA